MEASLTAVITCHDQSNHKGNKPAEVNRKTVRTGGKTIMGKRKQI